MKRATRSSSTTAAASTGHTKAPRFVFRLFISGTTPRSTRAIRNIRKICDLHLTGRYDLEVVDIYQQPGLAGSEQIIAAPTLVKSLPLPLRRFIGDISDTERLLIGIGVRPEPGNVSP